MGLYGLLVLGLMATISALGRWRSGLLWMCAIAVLQDPLRKLVPGAPGYLLLISLPVVLATGLGMISSIPNAWPKFATKFPAIRNAFELFLAACIPAAFISLTYGPGSWAYTAFGLIAYGIIFGSILIGFLFLRTEADVRRLLSFYCLITALALSGTYFEYFHIDILGNLIGTESLNFEWVRHRSGYLVKMLAGFYRSPDVMGWHAATASMLSLVLVFAGNQKGRWRWLIVTAIGVGALMVSGRRKMVFLVPLFILLIIGLLISSRKRGLSIQAILPLVIPILIGLLAGQWLGSESEFVRYYTDDPGDIQTQAQTHIWDSVLETYNQSGFWGSGLGFAAPGAQNLPYPKPRIWQESGASRLMVELGVPGAIAILLLLSRIFLTGIKNVRRQIRLKSKYANYSIALLAFTMANLASLSVSGQILADPFIAFFIGSTIGMQLSFSRLC